MAQRQEADQRHAAQEAAAAAATTAPAPGEGAPPGGAAPAPRLPAFYQEDTPASANEMWQRLHADPLFAIKQQVGWAVGLFCFHSGCQAVFYSCCCWPSACGLVLTCLLVLREQLVMISMPSGYCIALQHI